MSRLFDSRFAPQRVHQASLQALDETRPPFGGIVAEKSLHQDPVQRAHDETAVELRRDVLAEESLLAAALENVGKEIQEDALELAHVPREVVGMLLVTQDEAQEELDRVDVLRDEGVVLV